MIVLYIIALQAIKLIPLNLKFQQNPWTVSQKVSDTWNLENFNNNNHIAMWHGINVKKYFGKNIKIKKNHGYIICSKIICQYKQQ